MGVLHRVGVRFDGRIGGWVRWMPGWPELMDGWMGRDRWWNGIVRQLGAKLPALTRSLAHWRHRRASPLRRAKRSNVNVVAVSASVGRRSSGFWYLHQLILFDEEVESIPLFLGLSSLVDQTGEARLELGVFEVLHITIVVAVTLAVSKRL